MLFVPRYVASFDLSDSQTLWRGLRARSQQCTAATRNFTASICFGNGSRPISTRLSVRFPGPLKRCCGASKRAFPGDTDIPALPRETLTDFGIYSQILYGFRKGWLLVCVAITSSRTSKAVQLS